MALNATECDEIISVMEETGRRVQLGFVYRGTPVSLAAKTFIDAGRLGNVYHAKASLYRRRGIPGLGGWFTTKSRSGGGPLIDLGVHVIDLVLHLVGYPAARRASAACYSTFGSPMESYRYVDMWAGPPRFDGAFDVEDAAHGLIRFDGGFTLEVNVTWAANIPEGVLSDGVVLCGDRGGCAFNLLGRDLTIATEEEGHIVDVKPMVEPIDVMDAAWAKQYEQFIDVVTDGTTPVASAANGRSIQAILDAMYESSAQQREVEVR
jgi:predicted dehydrogenase